MAGQFGDSYIERNQPERLLFKKVALFARMLQGANNVSSVRELGCNIGLNLLALNRLQPQLALEWIEINAKAAKAAATLGVAGITQGSILQPITCASVDLSFIVGVLIHIEPDHLPDAY